MARPKKQVAEQKTENTVNIIGSTIEQEQKDKSQDLHGADVITIVSGLRNGHKFDDVGSSNRGIVIIPGIDDHLRGARDGVLSADGNAIMFTMKKSDWTDILAKHGRERMFVGGRNGQALVFAIGSTENAKNEFKAHKDEINAMTTGLAPVSMTSQNVVETNK